MTRIIKAIAYNLGDWVADLAEAVVEWASVPSEPGKLSQASRPGKSPICSTCLRRV